MRTRYNEVARLAKNYSDVEISRQLGLSRPTVQRYRWLTQLPEYVREAFLTGSFPDRFIFDLWTVRDSKRVLRDTFNNLPRRRYSVRVTRTIGEVRKALTHSDLDKRTLLWVLNAS